MAEEPRLIVHMLGEFSICKPNGEMLQQKGARSVKTQRLLALLLNNAGKSIPQERFIDILWPDSDSADPANALKNQVYRARQLLDAFAGEKTDFILFSKNAYRWNPAIPCRIDTVELTRIADITIGPDSIEQDKAEERIALYYKAIDVYQGEFMANLAGDEWIYTQRSYYEGIYIRCVLNLCHLLRIWGRTDELISVCERALEYCPFQEEIHRALLIGYVRARRHEKALQHYNSVSQLYNRELGIGLPASIMELYQDIVREMHWIETDIEQIHKEIFHIEPEEGAFLCEYPVFQQLCVVQRRSQDRTNHVMMLLLLTVQKSGKTKDGKALRPDILKYMMQALQSCIVKTLRKNDLVCRYSPYQFLLGVEVSGGEDATIIFDRIKEAFANKYYGKNVVLTSQSVIFE